MPVTLTNRLPKIMVELPAAVGAAIHLGAERVAERASAEAPVRTHRLERSVEARVIEQDVVVGAPVSGIYANFYWYFDEFGTVHQAARPFMVPALEAEKEGIIASVEAAMHEL